MQAVHRVGNSAAEVVIIAGYSGVGKSSLVKEIKKSNAGNIGFFINGKCDQFKRNEPLSALLSAFRQLLQQLLMLDENSIAAWRAKVTEAVGAAGQVIVEVLPEAGLLMGEQPALPVLPPIETKNRFTETFSRFVKVFCRQHSPLCIFLDDLQWMDSATRQWIELQLAGGNLSYLLLIGAFRDNEVAVSHPLMLMLDRLVKEGVNITTLSLLPLAMPVLSQLVGDTLHLPPAHCQDLCEVIFQKTNGNPFFTRQCLLSLHDNNAIYFDTENQCWAYDLHLVQQAEISDNVIDLMVQQIQQLPSSTQYLLMSAACMGNRFGLQTLSLVHNKTTAATKAELVYALGQGLIIPVDAWQAQNEEFVFLHDRVQQALLSLLPDDEKVKTHLKIGNVLLAGMASMGTDEKIYEVANHLNYAHHLITDNEERMRLSEINTTASIRARNASAYEQANAYITTAMDILPAAARNQPSAYNRELYLQRADCEHLCGNNEVADRFYNDAMSLATTALEKAAIAQRKIQYYINLGKFTAAYQEGRKAVKTLGIYLPPKFIPPLLIKDLARYRWLLGNRKIEDLIALPDMQDERMKAAVLLMSTFARAAYQIKPELCIAVCFKIVNACLHYGNTQGGNVGFLAVGPIFFGAILKFKQTGFEFGQLTLALVEKYKSQAFKAEAHFVIGYFAMPWRRPVLEMEQYWQIAYEAGLEAGDLFHASCACCGTIQSLYMRGVGFDEIIKTIERYLGFLQRINNQEAILTLMAVRQSICNLRGETKSSDSYDTTSFDEAEYIQALQGFGSRHFAHYYYINKMQTLYWWGEYEKAYQVALQSDKYLKDSPGMLHTAEHFFYKGLIICALYPAAGNRQKLQWKKTLYTIRRNFAKYAAGCEYNFIHKYQLLSAEIHRVYHDAQQAENAYYAAITSATAFGYTNIVALANELLSRFHYAGGHYLPAGFHLRLAETACKTLGATGYAKFLRSRYPRLSDASKEFILPGQDLLNTEMVMQEGKTKTSLDFDTVLKSSEAISREIRLPDLLAALMKIIIENAGAQRMVLLLQQDKELVVYAERAADIEEVTLLHNIPLKAYEKLPRSVVYYAARKGEPLLLEDAQTSVYSNDVYIKETKPRSVLCAPLIKQGRLAGVIYVENKLTEGAFTQDRIDLLILLSGQAAIAIENALLYNNLEEKVMERTEELKGKNIELEITLTSLKESQRRLVQAEKLASMGQMATGVAHELFNPLNFIINFASASASMIQDLKELLPQAGNPKTEDAEEMEDILSDLQSNNEKIGSHGQKAEQIVRIMMQTSALMEDKKQASLAHILDEAIVRAESNFLKGKLPIAVTYAKHYCNEKETLRCMSQNLTGVFVNIFDNALYTIYQKKQKSQQDYVPQITIDIQLEKEVWIIKIRDNGEGIEHSNINKIFVPFFTTKPTGRGNTGNGLTPCHRVITEAHNGDIEVFSEWGNYTEFVITLPINN